MIIPGRVIDPITEKGIPFASIRIIDPGGNYTGIGTSADNNGQFFIDSALADAPNSIQVTSTGYKPITVKLDDSFFESYRGIFHLNRDEKELDPVVVTSGKKTNHAWLLLIPVAMAMSKKKGSVSGIPFNVGTVITVGAALVMFKGLSLVNDILAAFGLSKDKDDKRFDNENDDPESPLKPTLFEKADPAVHTATYNYVVARATDWGQQLLNAFGSFNDNESEAIGVFKKFRTQTEASCFAYIWEYEWQYPDLLQWLKGDGWPNDRLDTGEIAEILNYLHNLPIK